MLLTCQSGFEALLARELTELRGMPVEEKGPGWVRCVAPDIRRGEDTSSTKSDSDRKSSAPAGRDSSDSADRAHENRPGPRAEPALVDLAFAHLGFQAPVEVRGESVNALAQRIADYFLTSLRGERIEATWPCVWSGSSELVGLGRRISAVEAAFGELLKKKLSRVAKLATPGLPWGVGAVRGLFVFFADFGRAYVAREAWSGGQRRMADDDLAPSRSYLKVEEAYGVLGREPAAGETVCDLGAAPGGWSYSAAKRGARVVAIDNGPLKSGALDNPGIDHRREDAFRFSPGAGAPFDWLYCDMVEEPHHVLQHIVAPWLEQRWCRHFIINLKFGRVDPIALLEELRAPNSPLQRSGARFAVRHLYHDREEFTVVGTLNPEQS